MGRRSITGGIVPSGPARIQFNFTIDGVRFRPTLPWIPNQVNLDHARKHLARIKAQIEARTFCFSEAFPDYRGLKRIPAFRVGVSNCRAQTVPIAVREDTRRSGSGVARPHGFGFAIARHTLGENNAEGALQPRGVHTC
jgi:hypothetical protein